MPVSKTPFMLWLAHSVWTVCIGALLFTGLRIAHVTENFLPDWLLTVLPQGQVFIWHKYFAFILVSFLFSHFLLIFKQAKIKDYWPAFNDLSAGFMATRVMGFLMMLVVAVSGLASLFSGSTLAITLHWIFIWALVAFIILHVGLAAMDRGVIRSLLVFIPNFTNKNLALGFIIPVLTVLVVLSLLEKNETTLQLAKFSEVNIELDGEARESYWAQIDALTIVTRQGHQGSSVPVSIKALHDNEFGYFLFQWPDDSRSLKHLPLVKTPQGWKVSQTALGNADENRYYEDKFAVMLSFSGEFSGAGTVHLGAKPMAQNPHADSGRGLHYTLNEEYTDVWHWKAVRTGLSLGQADDNYFGPPSPSNSEYKRYTGGYQQDPDCEHLLRWQGNDFHLKPQCGGFIMNWQEYRDDVIQPRRLPKAKSFLKRMGNADLNSTSSDHGRWWMKFEETVKYNPDQDDYPVGSVIPSVITLGPLKQGRGGVSTGARWHNGQWTLEVKRKLKVDNKYDLPIMDGVYLWVAAFDHSQTRHSYHVHPLKLSLH
jgi:hypothetical protein